MIAMIKLKNPDDIYKKGNEHAVLLLHSFTGSVRDMKGLGEVLHERGYTTYVVSYPGHGLSLEQLLSTTIDDWWRKVDDSYRLLKAEGYKTVSVIGVSLGGLFALKLMETYPIDKGIVMSVPHFKDDEGIKFRLRNYGGRINQVLGLSDEESARQLNLVEEYQAGASLFRAYIEEIMSQLHNIQCPVYVMYGEQDDPSYKQSAQFIERHLQSDKKLSSFSQSKHLMTHGAGKEEVEEAVIRYFNV